MRVRVLWFGRPGADPFRSVVATYVERVARRWPAEDLPLRPEAGGRSGDPARVRSREAAAVRNRIPERFRTVVLDERGWQPDSVGLARWLGELETGGVPGVAFVIGSDLGLDPGLREAADRVLSLSRLTLPHRVARLVLWEQLYRAVSLLGGGGYHRSG